MALFSHRKVGRNYDLLSSCSWYTPGIGGMFAVLGWFLLGALIGSLTAKGISLFLDPGYATLIGYPLMFVPPFIYVRLKSASNRTFDRGYCLDSNHFGPGGGAVSAVVAVLLALAAAVILDALDSLMPPMPVNLKLTLELLMGGPLWLSLLQVSVLAPVCEEWLCRGVILRGLLNYKGTDARNPETPRGMVPALAIFIQALFFAAIHMNIWQGLAALLIGCVMGYVYYKTGSLKLTMLMHCANNTASVLVYKYCGVDSFLDLVPVKWIVIVLAAVLVMVTLAYFTKVPLQDPQGNCDVIPSSDDLAGVTEAESL